MIYRILEAFSRIQNLIIVDALNNVMVHNDGPAHYRMQAGWDSLIYTLTELSNRRFIVVVRSQYVGPIPNNVTIVNLETESGELDDIVCIVLAYVLTVKIATRDRYSNHNADALFHRAWRCEFGGLSNNWHYFQNLILMKSVMDSVSFSDATFIPRVLACGDNDDALTQLFEQTKTGCIQEPIRQLARTIRQLEAPRIIYC